MDDPTLVAMYTQKRRSKFHIPLSKKFFMWMLIGIGVFLLLTFGGESLDVDAMQAYTSTKTNISVTNLVKEVDIARQQEEGGGEESPSIVGDRNNFITIFQGPYDTWAVEGKAISNPTGDTDVLNGETMSMAGCGVASTAMVVRNYTGDDQWDCHTICVKYSEAGLPCPSQSTEAITNFFNTKYPEFGLTATYHQGSDQMTPEKIDEVLSKGGYIIVDKHECNSCANRDLFAEGTVGHYIVIYAGNKNDGYRVGDSNSSHQHRGEDPFYDKVFTKEEMAACPQQTNDYWYAILPSESGGGAE